MIQVNTSSLLGALFFPDGVYAHRPFTIHVSYSIRSLALKGLFMHLFRCCKTDVRPPGPRRGRGWGGFSPPFFCKNKNKLNKKIFLHAFFFSPPLENLLRGPWSRKEVLDSVGQMATKRIPNQKCSLMWRESEIFPNPIFCSYKRKREKQL